MAEIKKTTPKPSVSVCILTKNDENTLEECIESIKDFAREIVVIDTGSTDSTISIARNHTNRIWGVKWNQDYAESLNWFFKYASSDWILFLYGFEKVTIETKKFLNAKMLDKKNVAYLFKIVQVYHDKEYTNYDIKLFKRMNEIKFKHVINSNVTDDIQKIAKTKNMSIVPSDVIIEKMNYRKYRDDSEYHSEVVSITTKALEGEKKLEHYVEVLYKLLKGLSLGCLGEYETAEETVEAILEEVRKMDKKAAYNVPVFIQAYLFFCYEYSKRKEYKKALEVMSEAIEIYHNSLTVILRYAEQLYMNGDFKGCYQNILKLKTLLEEEDFYYLESIDFYLIEKLSIKLFNLAKNKLEME
ncbi:MAG: glycosyltransferase [Cyanobacteriota bacterium]|mgnify:CR=1 FL=1